MMFNYCRTNHIHMIWCVACSYMIRIKTLSKPGQSEISHTSSYGATTTEPLIPRFPKQVYQLDNSSRLDSALIVHILPLSCKLPQGNLAGSAVFDLTGWRPFQNFHTIRLGSGHRRLATLNVKGYGPKVRRANKSFKLFSVENA